MRFRYNGNGAIRPTRSDDTMADTVITTLNLNDPAIKAERGRLLAGIETDIQAGDIASVNRAEMIADYRRRTEDGRLKSLGHVVARYLEDEPF